MNDIVKIEDFNLDNFLIDEKSYENILVYNIFYKTLIDAKPLHIRFDKIDGFIRVYDRTRYLVLLVSKKYDFIYNRVRYLIGLDKYDYLPLQKTMTFHNAIILIKSVFNKDENNYYCGIFLEKALCELPKKYIFV